MSAQVHPFPLAEAEESLGQRARRLQAEARAAALEHIAALVECLEVVEHECREVAEGGQAYPPGVRDRAARLLDAIQTGRQGITALLERVS